jgi:hypothetical protein
MNIALFRTLAALFPPSLLLYGSTVLFRRQKTLYGFMQVFGAGCLVVVVLTHICEALHVFPAMRWGLEHSAGHHVDLASVILGLTLFPIGYLMHAISSTQNSDSVVKKREM